MNMVTEARRQHALLLTLCIAALAWLQAGNGWSAGAPPFAAEWPRTDFTRRAVDLNEIESGGPPKDGIPAVDKPRFVPSQEASRWLDAREPVIVFEHAADARAYPLQILMFHEIVNDTVGGLPVAVTFCPLCNASIVFDRRVAGAVLDLKGARLKPVDSGVHFAFAWLAFNPASEIYGKTGVSRR